MGCLDKSKLDWNQFVQENNIRWVSIEEYCVYQMLFIGLLDNFSAMLIRREEEAV